MHERRKIKEPEPSCPNYLSELHIQISMAVQSLKLHTIRILSS